MRILGIDPGLATTGFGVLDSGRGSEVARGYGAIKTSSDKAIVERLDTIFDDVRDLVERYQPGAMAIEKLFFGKNASSAFAVGQARGVCILAAAKGGLAVYEYTPPQVKTAVVGYGKATKSQVQAMVQQLLSLPEVPRPVDAADALAIALCCSQSNRLQQLPGVSS